MYLIVLGFCVVLVAVIAGLEGQKNDAPVVASNNTQNNATSTTETDKPVLHNLSVKTFTKDGIPTIEYSNTGNTDWHNCIFVDAPFYKTDPKLIPKHSSYDLQASDFYPTDEAKKMNVYGGLDDDTFKVNSQQGIGINCDEGSEVSYKK